ncbi:hypothetical protein DFH09DRAFT_1342070 [Mycena vulgaris]|nr:hypothetical protein DFH09DRAFT_1342070 [Mycena vulgaris]
MSPTRVTVTLPALALLRPRSLSSCRLLVAVVAPLLPLIVYTKFDPPPTPGSSRPCPTQHENSRDDINRTVIKVVDGLLFASGDALLSVTSAATVALTLRGFLSGLSTEVAALHVTLSLSSGISVSMQIMTLQGFLLGERHGDLAQRFAAVIAWCFRVLYNTCEATCVSRVRIRT